MRTVLATVFLTAFLFASNFPNKSLPLIIVNDFFYPQTPFSHGNLMVSVIEERLEKLGMEESRDYYLIKASYVDSDSGMVNELSTQTFIDGEPTSLIQYVRSLQNRGHKHIILNMSYVDSASLDDALKRHKIYTINQKLFALSRDVTINKASGNNHLKSYLREYVKDLTRYHELPKGFEQTMAKIFIQNLDQYRLEEIIKRSHTDAATQLGYALPIQYVNDIFNIFIREYEVFGQLVEFYRLIHTQKEQESHHFNIIYSVKHAQELPYLGFINALDTFQTDAPRTMNGSFQRTNHPIFEYETPFDHYYSDHFIMTVEGKEILLKGTSAATALKSAEDTFEIHKKRLASKLAQTLESR